MRTRIVHLSDAHVASEGKQYLPGVDLAARAGRALSAALSLDPSPSLVVLGGDMLDEGPSPDYGRLSALVAGAPCPVHLCLGNHDSLDAFRKAPLPTFPAACPGYYAFDFEGFRVLLLFTAAARRGKGDIDPVQLSWLAGELHAVAASRGRALLFMHHPPVDVGIPWLDAIRIENAGQFWDAVGPSAAHVAGIFFAHLHIQVSMSRQGILLASPPAAGWQFRADHTAARAETSGELPGFNVIEAWDEPAGSGVPDSPTVTTRSRTSGLLVRTVRFVP